METMKPSIALTAIVVVSMSLMAFKKDDANKNLPKSFREKFAYFEVKDFEIGEEKFHTDAFYMATTEVSNVEYRLFLSELKSEGNMNLYNQCNIDSAGWREELAYNEPFVVYYHRHPVYNNYPVVNISYQGALEYCKWWEKKMNAEGAESGNSYEVRLPTKAEWVRAARGIHDNSVYAWGGPSLQNAKGTVLCNYRYLGDESVSFDQESGEYCIIKGQGSMGTAGYVRDNVDITTPVFAYSPSDMGLYNMNGNVAEMVSEQGIAMGGSWRSPGYDVRNESQMNYSKPMPNVGFRPLVKKKKN
jgi:formylglycine-generating enzyme required for sulfatase activity